MANYCFVAPILPGGETRMKNWYNEEIKHNKDHDRVFQEGGITREQVWIQHTPMGDFAVASLEVKDAKKAFETIATSKDPWAEQFRSFLKAAHGLDFSQPVPLNVQEVDWHAE
jgi:hypothetical protein